MIKSMKHLTFSKLNRVKFFHPIWDPDLHLVYLDLHR